jgi:hypothetical protein
MTTKKTAPEKSTEKKIERPTIAGLVELAKMLNSMHVKDAAIASARAALAAGGQDLVAMRRFKYDGILLQPGGVIRLSPQSGWDNNLVEHGFVCSEQFWKKSQLAEKAAAALERMKPNRERLAEIQKVRRRAAETLEGLDREAARIQTERERAIEAIAKVDREAPGLERGIEKILIYALSPNTDPIGRPAAPAVEGEGAAPVILPSIDARKQLQGEAERRGMGPELATP